MASKYQAYPEYKDSEVEWIGEMPIGWVKTRINTICCFQKGYGLSKGDLSENGNNPCILYGELYTAYKDFNEILKVKSKTDVGIGCLSEGDEILIPGSTTTTGIDLANANYLPHKGVLLGGDIIILKPRKEYNKRFVSYFITNVNPREFIRYSKGVTIYHIYASSIKDMPIFLPPLEDQDHIVNFLGHVTAKIDTLIKKQQKLIKLLKEKRQAVISHAVTKGLNPNASMRDSGVEWFGEVPEHWDVAMLGKKIQLQRGVDITKDEQTHGKIPVVSSGGISSFHNKSTCTGPGVVVGRKGTAGKLHFIESDFWAHDTTLYVKEFRGNNVRYVYYKLISMELDTFDTGSANPTLNRNNVHPVKVSWAPLGEQIQIVEYLDGFCIKADQITEQINNAISLLKERRTALISAAVTGKIDVRYWQSPEQNQNNEEEAA